jgi:hypothetical protein
VLVVFKKKEKRKAIFRAIKRKAGREGSYREIR